MPKIDVGSYTTTTTTIIVHSADYGSPVSQYIRKRLPHLRSLLRGPDHCSVFKQVRLVCQRASVTNVRWVRWITMTFSVLETQLAEPVMYTCILTFRCIKYVYDASAR